MTNEPISEIEIEELTKFSDGAGVRLLAVLFFITAICFILSLVFVKKNTDNSTAGTEEPYIQEGIEFVTNELKKLQTGDFIELQNGQILVVPDVRPSDQFLITLAQAYLAPEQRGIEITAKNTKRIVKNTDPDWPEIARKFLVPHQPVPLAGRMR